MQQGHAVIAFVVELEHSDAEWNLHACMEKALSGLDAKVLSLAMIEQLREDVATKMDHVPQPLVLYQSQAIRFLGRWDFPSDAAPPTKKRSA